MSSTAVIYRRLLADPLIAYELDEYGSLPAVFDDEAPVDFVQGPALMIIIAAPSSVVSAATLTEKSWTYRQDVRVYAKHNGSNARLDLLAAHIRDLFDIEPDSQEGVTVATATGPLAAPTSDPAVVGRRVTIQLTIKED